jgi:hypothetical protein
MLSRAAIYTQSRMLRLVGGIRIGADVPRVREEEHRIWHKTAEGDTGDGSGRYASQNQQNEKPIAAQVTPW